MEIAGRWAVGLEEDCKTLQFVFVLVKARYPREINQIHKSAFPNE